MAIYLRGTSYYYDFVHRGQRYMGCFGKVSKTVAKEEEARKRTHVIEGKLNPARNRRSPYLTDFLEEYLKWARTNRKPLTVKAIEVRSKPLLSFFGRIKLNEFHPFRIEQYKQHRRKDGLQNSTINYELALLGSLFTRAVEWKKAADNPVRGVKPLRVENGRTRFLDGEEEERILAACSPFLRPLVETALLTGLRPQEVTSLRAENVNLRLQSLTVAACYAKNGESRTLPMGSRLQRLLGPILTAREVQGEGRESACSTLTGVGENSSKKSRQGFQPSARSAPDPDAVAGRNQQAPLLATASGSGVIFLTYRGRPWSPSTFSECFKVTCHKAGVVPCGPHTLRHTFASRLVMAGVDVRTVQELLGHKDIQQTLRYTHVSPSHKKQAIEKLENFSDSQKSPVNFHDSTTLEKAKIA